MVKNIFFQLIYTSKPSPQLTEKNMINILVDAQQYNQQKVISGFLLYSPEKLIQLIEGDEVNVMDLFHKIKKDKRHYDIIIRHSGFVDKRCMPCLGMGLCFLEETNHQDHHFYFTRSEAKNFSTLIKGHIGEIFVKYLD